MMKQLFIAIASLVLAGMANAANISVEVAASTDKVNVVFISGDIVKGDYEKFIKATKSITNNKSVVLLLDGPGGLLIEAMDIGLEVNKRKYITLAHKGVCASACAYIWLAGERSIIDVDSNAKVGFHAPFYVDKFGNKKSDNSASAILGGYLREIGAGYSVISYTTSVDGDSIRWLTESHAKEIGLSAEFFRSQSKTTQSTNTNTNTNKSALELAQSEIFKTLEYNRIFNIQMLQLDAAGQTGSADYIRIQKAIAQNNQWIKQQWDIITRLQSK